MAKTSVEKVIKTARIPLVANMWNRDTGATAAKDSIWTNCAFSIVSNPTVDKKTLRIRKRQGLESLSLAGADLIRCYDGRVWQGESLDNIVFLVRSSTATDDIKLRKLTTASMTLSTLGTAEIDGASTVSTASRLTECYESGGLNPTIAFWAAAASGTKEAYFFPLSGALTQITDGDFPVADIAGNFVYSDGYLFIITNDGVIWNSDSNSLSAWTATSFQNSGGEPDGGVGLAKYKDKIVAINANSIEFFEMNPNFSGTGSPLQRVNHLRISDIGGMTTTLDSNQTYLSAFNTLFWLAKGNDREGAVLYKLENYVPTKLTNSTVASRFIKTNAGLLHISGAGHYLNEPVLFFNAETDLDTYVYFIDLDIWSYWDWNDTTVANTPGMRPVFHDETSDAVGGLYWFGNGDVFRMDHSDPVYQDGGNAYTMSITTSKIDLDTENRKRLHKLKLIGNVQSSTSNLSVSWSDNDYSSFTTARTIDTSQQRQYLNNCGAFRRRAFKLEHSGNTPFEAESLELDYSVCEN